MTDFQRIILVHYHEIGLKGHNRASFEMRLLKNLEALLAPFPVVTIHRIAGRLLVFLREGTDWENSETRPPMRSAEYRASHACHAASSARASWT